jgi:subtilisin family serine protease
MRRRPGPVTALVALVAVALVAVVLSVPAGVAGAAVARSRYVVAAADERALDELRAALDGLGADPVLEWRGHLHGLVVALAADEVPVVAGWPGVVGVEAEVPMRRSAASIDPPWGLDRIDQATPTLDGRYDPARTGAGVHVYVVDSGLWAAHQDFAGRIRDGAYYPFLDGLQGSDCTGHGTHVAGTVLGATHGVATQALLHPIRVFDCSGETTSGIVIAGIVWAIEHHQAGTPAVMNLSLGGPPSASVDAAVAAAVADGIVVVVAAGNETVDACTTSPARVPQAITVAASDRGDRLAAFSNYGPCVDLLAPGVGIRSAASGTTDGSAVLSGTSMATPHVAGAAALVLEQFPAASPAEVAARLVAAATPGAAAVCCNTPNRMVRVANPGVVERPVEAGSAPAVLVPVNPDRLLDTRPGSLAGYTGPIPGPGATVRIPVAGRVGLPADATAAVLNVTVVDAIGPGFVQVYPTDVGVPGASSNLNVGRAGQVIANGVIVPLGPDGSVTVFTQSGAHLVVDVTGVFVPAGATATAGRFRGVAPERILDTRTGLGTTGPGRRSARSVLRLPVAGRAGVPTTGAAAVALNVTATGAAGAGYVQVWPAEAPRPTSSNVNLERIDQTIPNQVIVGLGADGAIDLYTDAATHLLVDVVGWFTDASSPASAAGRFVAVTPGRVLDTRPESRIGYDGATPGAGALVTAVTGLAGAAAVAGNLTIVDARGAGFVQAAAAGALVPGASSTVNAERSGHTVPNALIVPTTAGAIDLFTQTGGHLLLDVAGWFTT